MKMHWVTGIPQSICNLGSNLRWTISVKPRLFYLRAFTGNMPRYPLNRKLALLQSLTSLQRSQNMFQQNRSVWLHITVRFTGTLNTRGDTESELWSVLRFKCLAFNTADGVIWRSPIVDGASSWVVTGCTWLYHAAIDGTKRIRRKHISALCKHIYVWNCKCQIRWGGMGAGHNWWVGVTVSELLSYAGLSRHVKNARRSGSQWIRYIGAQVVLLSDRKEKR